MKWWRCVIPLGLWERRSGQSKQKLSQALVLSKGEWVNPLTIPDTLGKVQIGNPCRFGTKKDRFMVVKYRSGCIRMKRMEVRLKLF